jgi:hypothetical protein
VGIDQVVGQQGVECGNILFSYGVHTLFIQVNDFLRIACHLFLRLIMRSLRMLSDVLALLRTSPLPLYHALPAPTSPQARGRDRTTARAADGGPAAPDCRMLCPNLGSADFEDQLAAQVARFADPVRFCRLGEPVADDLGRPHRAARQKC